MNADAPKTLRELLVAGAGIVIPGAANALAARIIETSGFPIAYVTGAGVANSYLGAPDMGLTTATEMVAHIAACREAVAIPLIADGDTGFGNALNLFRTVRLYEQAGAGAIQLEDQEFPKRCGHFEGKTVVAMREMVDKIRAATDARRDASFLIIARTDARAVEGMNAALDRAAAYREAGADVLFVEAPQSEQELAAIPRQVPGVHLCNIVIGGKTPMLARDQLAAMGYAGILYANAALQAAMLAMTKTLAHLKRTGSLDGATDPLMTFADRQSAVDFARWSDLDRRYTST
jgi:2-methylisocitrate lyase-like PEP mutase family enzyme